MTVFLIIQELWPNANFDQGQMTQNGKNESSDSYLQDIVLITCMKFQDCISYGAMALTRVLSMGEQNHHKIFRADCTRYIYNWAASSKKVPSNMRKMRGFGFIMRMRKVWSGTLLSIYTFCSIQWFYLWTLKALIGLRACAVRSDARSLIWVFAVCICLKTRLSTAWPNWYCPGQNYATTQRSNIGVQNWNFKLNFTMQRLS